MARAFIGVGSNEGDRLKLISQAVRAVGSSNGVRIVQMAPIIETDPIGGPPQGPYLNTVVECETTRAPLDVLNALQAIERALGRRSSRERWGPRPIDLDLLLYDDRVIREPSLSIPHPRMHERRFVLEPLAQLAPEVRHPLLHQSIVEILAHLPSL